LPVSYSGISLERVLPNSEESVLWICVGVSAKNFTNATFPKLSSCGQMLLGEKPVAKVLSNKLNVFVIEFTNKCSVDTQYAVDVATNVVETFKPIVRKVVVFDTLSASSFVSHGPIDPICPPFTRLVATRKAKGSNKSVSENSEDNIIPFLETGNIVTGIAAAIIQECEITNLWAIGVLSLVDVRNDGQTAVAFLPALDLLSIKGQEAGFPRDRGTIRTECLKVREESDYGRDAMFV